MLSVKREARKLFYESCIYDWFAPWDMPFLWLFRSVTGPRLSDAPIKREFREHGPYWLCSGGSRLLGLRRLYLCNSGQMLVCPFDAHTVDQFGNAIEDGRVT